MSLAVIVHWSLAFALSFALATGEVAPLARPEFERLHRDLVPASRRTWEKVGWRVDLLSAREEARKSKRPIFLWAMNGHPLGCT